MVAKRIHGSLGLWHRSSVEEDVRDWQGKGRGKGRLKCLRTYARSAAGPIAVGRRLGWAKDGNLGVDGEISLRLGLPSRI